VHVLDHSFSDMLRYLRPGIRRLVTVHDLIPLYDSTGLSPAQVTGFRQRVSHMTRAEKLLAVSRYTQQCISEQFPTAVSRTQVLPLGVELPPLVQHARSCSILSVGSTLTRKNLHILPQVFQQLREKGLSPSLIRIGAKLPTTLKSELLRVMGDSSLHELGFVSDTELCHQYATAGLVLFPSTMEGFGLPVLEAMAHGCPVVSSTATSLPEVAGEAALLFDPQDASTAAEHCHNILSQSAVSDKMARQGRSRAEELSWSIHWQSLLHQYEEAMS
jgi:glycosyltransferase involved in cell wall biosynthesis